MVGRLKTDLWCAKGGLAVQQGMKMVSIVKGSGLVKQCKGLLCYETIQILAFIVAHTFLGGQWEPLVLE